MENYSRRNKIILSLVGTLIFLYNSCNTYKIVTPPIPIPILKEDKQLYNYSKKSEIIVTIVKNYNLSNSNETKFLDNSYEEDFDSLIIKKDKRKITKDKYFVISLKDFITNYQIKENILLDKNKSTKSIINILRFKNHNELKILSINKGIFTAVNIIEDGYPLDSEGYDFDGKGNIDYLYNNLSNIYIKTNNQNINYEKLDFSYYPLKKKFYSGNGNWERFYYVQDKNLEYLVTHVKENGEVKNNYKFGEWKYYNKSGVIDSTKIYTLKDSIDVRFPYCIFNKKEPCFCENK
ncbi:hypothetical protein HNQ02_003786 [Flavobacterium sp. 7E]|uniref:hypothetical protein n=1 Tax=Flavobacterium sp. 7E TaxID=2735898 RepID=UPI00156F99EA|nr:hypothetical protein [Flavobacterium sp. 7E]NRS90839.1 hypothetical protein [Flavobacterium sp. 7E]